MVFAVYSRERNTIKCPIKMPADILMVVLQMLGGNLVSMQLVGMCGKVCPLWRAMAAAVCNAIRGAQESADTTGFAAKYVLSAVVYGANLRVQMHKMYATALGADIARRNQIVNYDNTDHDAENEIHMQLWFQCENAAQYLAGGLQAHLMHAPTMILCLQELSNLTAAFSGQAFVPLRLTRLCQWPVLKILQAHPNNTMLGHHALVALLDLSDVQTPQAFEYESIPTYAARLAAEDIVSGFLARFRPPATVPEAVTLLLDNGDDVLTWIREGTLIHPDEDE